MSRNKLNRIFNPTPEEQQEDKKRLLSIYREQAEFKGCSTCKYCKHIIDYPGFVIGEECVCLAGLKCDTVLFLINNCPKWKGVMNEVSRR
jgi:hypothetical protein